MDNNRPGMADYMLAVMQQIVDKAVVEMEITEAEKKKLTELNEETVKAKYMTSKEWEVLA